MRLKKFRYFVMLAVFAFLAGSAPPMSKPSTSQKTEGEAEKVGTLEDIWLPPDIGADEKAEWKNGQPPGWSRGKKKGWHGGKMPPGLAKKEGISETEENPPDWNTWKKEQRTRWEEELNKIKERVRKNADKTSVETMIYSAEAAARKGVPVQQLGTVTDRSIKKKLSGTEYEKVTRAMAYGVGKNVDYTKLGEFVNSSIDQGLRGNELAISIYKEIAARSGK